VTVPFATGYAANYQKVNAPWHIDILAEQLIKMNTWSGLNAHTTAAKVMITILMKTRQPFAVALSYGKNMASIAI
jgi:hypothetical protein